MLKNPEAMSDPVLPDVSEMGAAAGRHSCDRSHHHRQPGGHNRRVFADAPGHSPWLPAAHGDLPYVRNPYGPDLPAERQHAFDVRRHGAGLPSSAPRRSLATAYGISVTGAMVVTTVLSFEFLRTRWNWPTSWVGRCAAAAVRAGIRLPRRQHAEDPRWRLRADPDRGDLHRHHVDLEARHSNPARQDPPYRHSAGKLHQIDRAQERACAGVGARHGGIPDQRSGIDARRPAAQHQAQPRSASAELHPDDPDGKHAEGAEGRARQRAAVVGALHSAGNAASASWRRRTSRRRWASSASRA